MNKIINVVVMVFVVTLMMSLTNLAFSGELLEGKQVPMFNQVTIKAVENGEISLILNEQFVRQGEQSNLVVSNRFNALSGIPAEMMVRGEMAEVVGKASPGCIIINALGYPEYLEWC